VLALPADLHALEVKAPPKRLSISFIEYLIRIGLKIEPTYSIVRFVRYTSLHCKFYNMNHYSNLELITSEYKHFLGEFYIIEPARIKAALFVFSVSNISILAGIEKLFCPGAENVVNRPEMGTMFHETLKRAFRFLNRSNQIIIDQRIFNGDPKIQQATDLKLSGRSTRK
jgi:hypothetical protein